jgi:glycosidase
MQWSDGQGMGFTDGAVTPWLPFADATTSVADQLDDPASTLSLYRSLLELRHATPALSLGSIAMLTSNEDHVLSFTRNLRDDTVSIAINFTAEPQRFTFPTSVTQMLGTAGDRRGEFTDVTLAPNEAIIVR